MIAHEKIQKGRYAKLYGQETLLSIFQLAYPPAIIKKLTIEDEF